MPTVNWYDIKKFRDCPVCEFALLETHSKELIIDDPRTLYKAVRKGHVIALSENGVAKIFDSKSEMELEVEKMRFANSINDLVVKFIRTDVDKDKELQQVARDAELGKRFADKLVQLWRTNGDEAWV